MSGRTIVVGAGLSGLSAAWALSKGGGDVEVFEASTRPGGAVRTERRDGYLVELGPNTVRPTAPLWGLVSALGQTGEALLADPRTPRYVDFAGELHPLPIGFLAFLQSRLLSSSGKWRLLAEPFQRSAPAEDESVADFVRRRLGPEAAERLVEPFVAGVFASSASRLSAVAAFPKLVRWEREGGSIVWGALSDRRRSPKPATNPPRGLLSFRDGLEALPRALAAALGPALHQRTAVTAVSPKTGGGWTVNVGNESRDAERVVVAVPAHAAVRLVAAFAPDAASALSAIPHPPLAVLHLSWPEAALRRPLHGFGHLVCPDPSRRILGAVWSSSLFPGRAPSGRVLLTVFLGGTRDPDAPSLSDDALTALAARDLEAEGIARGDPERVLLTRWERAIPQYERGHGDRVTALAAAEARWQGLHFLGNYRGGISVGDVVASALDAAASFGVAGRRGGL
jgi:oxygen-dependent protoporphyrinogen oxidase